MLSQLACSVNPTETLPMETLPNNSHWKHPMKTLPMETLPMETLPNNSH